MIIILNNLKRSFKKSECFVTSSPHRVGVLSESSALTRSVSQFRNNYSSLQQESVQLTREPERLFKRSLDICIFLHISILTACVYVCHV